MSITTHINTFFTYLQESSSTDVIEPTCYTQNRSRKRKLSRSQRNKRYNQLTKNNQKSKYVFNILYNTNVLIEKLCYNFEAKLGICHDQGISSST